VTNNTTLLRSLNRSLVLKTIRERGAASRAAIARATGLTSAGVGVIVGELADQGFLTEQADETQRTAAGRPPVLVRLNPDAAYSVGINVGVTRMTAVLTDLTGQVRARDQRPVISTDTLVQTAATAIDTITAGVDRTRVLGVGAGLHGIVDTAAGMLVFAAHYGWRNVPIGAMLQEATGLPVLLENGVRTMLLGELWYGAARSLTDVLCVAVGAGIGAGILSGGRLLRGPSGAAGEIGHTTVEPSGPLCSCGNYGCLETFASGPAIVARARALRGRGRPDLTDAAEVAQLAAQGDPVCTRVLDEAARYLGIGVANVCTTLDLRHILLGGGVSRAGQLFWDVFQGTVGDRVLRAGGQPPVVHPLQLGDDASPLGGATLALERFFDTGSR